MKEKEWGIFFSLAGILIVLALIWVAACSSSNRSIELFWLAGAAAIGFLSGFTTGASTNAGSGMEFVKFIGTGILIPILGGAGTLYIGEKAYTEKNVYSSSDNLIEQTTNTATSFPNALLHPLAVMGLFFAVFALLAVIGIVAGAALREAKLIEIKTI